MKNTKDFLQHNKSKWKGDSLIRQTTVQPPKASNKQSYRPDIDGLRAIAVLSVVFSHANIPGFSGGFIGVDIFFVISGFLITTILIREIEDGNFSLVQFYERRARRILPALFCLLAFCLTAGYFFLPPHTYEILAKSVIATVVFASNLWFLQETGDYFGTAAEFEPLLHTWSLAVEEQFYVVVPLIIWITYRGGRLPVILAISTISLASFFLSAWATNSYPLFNFFSALTRAWELGIGSLLALGLFPRTAPRIVAELLAASGLAAIFVSVIIFSDNTPFPGLTALPVCFGTAIIIWSGGLHRTVTARFLSLRLLVGIGLISYSLYLWHWPPLVFARVYTGASSIEFHSAILIIILTILAAYLSWRFVERPFRSGPASKALSTATIFKLSAFSAFALFAFSLLISKSDGARWRVPLDIQAAFENASRLSDLEISCRKGKVETGLCYLGNAPDSDHSPEVLLWGDSHAAAFVPGVDLWLRDAGISGVASVTHGCAPLLDVSRIDAGKSLDCQSFNRDTMNFLRETPSIRTVVLSGRWALAAEGNRTESGAGIILNVANDAKGILGNDAVFAYGLERTISEIYRLGMDVVLLESVPEMGFNVPQAYVNLNFFGVPVPNGPSLDDYEKRNRVVLATIDRISGSFPVKRVSIAAELCTPICQTEMNGVVLYRDDDHISVDGSEFLIPRLLSRQ